MTINKSREWYVQKPLPINSVPNYVITVQLPISFHTFSSELWDFMFLPTNYALHTLLEDMSIRSTTTIPLILFEPRIPEKEIIKTQYKQILFKGSYKLPFWFSIFNSCHSDAQPSNILTQNLMITSIHRDIYRCFIKYGNWHFLGVNLKGFCCTWTTLPASSSIFSPTGLVHTSFIYVKTSSAINLLWMGSVHDQKV